MMKSYQRRFLRAPFREVIIYADGEIVSQAKALNISEGGLLLGEIPVFPNRDEVPLLIALPQIPIFRNFSLLKMQTFSKDLFPKQIIRVKARMVRREELSLDLENLFRSRFGLEFVKVDPLDQKKIDTYVTSFASNLIYLQTLIDSVSNDEESKLKVRVLAGILGYRDSERLAQLRSTVHKEYRSLQWL
jgi:hypothetical protein